MAEYGYQPTRIDPVVTTALTGAVGLTGLFALGKALKPWTRKMFNRDLAQVDKLAISERRGGWMPEGANNELARRAFAEFIGGQGVGEISSAQSLGMRLAHSPIMGAIERGARSVKLIETFDDLSFTKLIRESYGHEQIQALGPLGELAGFKNLPLPAGLQEKSETFFAFGKLYGQGKDEFVELPGRYTLFGRHATGERSSVIEKSVNDLNGSSSNLEEMHRLEVNLTARVKRYELSKTLAKRAGAQFEDDDKLAEARSQLRGLERKMDRLRHPDIKKPQTPVWMSKAFKGMDFGLNERGYSVFSKEYWSQTYNNWWRQWNPDDTSVIRELDHKRPFDALRAPEFSWQSLKNAFVGGGFGREINAWTVANYHLFNRINTTIAWNGIMPGMALSGRSTRFTPFPHFLNRAIWDHAPAVVAKWWLNQGYHGPYLSGPLAFIANIMFKRALPIYAAGFYSGYLNDTIGQIFGDRPSDAMARAYGRLQLGAAGIKDRLGLSGFSRNVNDLSGGALGYLAHPFVDMPVGLSKPELQEFQLHGDVPVRKGRWWSFGSSTPFRGERIQYFTPTSTRYASAGDVYKTDTLWGSPNEFYANAALPTPTHPFAFLRHFVTDRYHYENKHYADRPYPTSAPLFEPTSPWGAVLNPLLGWLVKPTQYYHQDELPYEIRGRHRGERNPRYRGEMRSLNEQIRDQAASRELTGYVTPSGEIQPMQAVPLPGADREVSRINAETLQDGDDRAEGIDNGIPIESLGEGARAVTPYGSGAVKSKKALKDINKNTRQAKRFTKGRMLEPALAPGLFGNEDPNDPRNRARLLSSSDPRFALGSAYYSITEIGGLYGFGAVSATGDLWANRPMIANAGRMTSFERTYWDRWNTGGMLPTPGLSEAFRRFLPHRFHSNTEYNPIRNRMPTWLPGSGGEDPAYFLDFLHGDPYTQVPNGETRLPGTSYEHLHGITGFEGLNLRSTQAGYSPGMLYGFMTGQHTPFAAYDEEIAERGGELHRQVLLDIKHQIGHDIRFDKQVEWNDQQLGVSGTIDAIATYADKGARAFEIHTLSDHAYHQLGAEGDSRHRAQLNLDLYESGLGSGNLIYVNRDHPDQRQSISMNFDEDLFKETVGNIMGVREQIKSEAQQGLWGHGAFYDDITKLSILADVAPWSQQYRTYRDYLVHLDDNELSPADRARINTIKKQVTERKHRFHFSPYKLRYADLTEQTVTIKRILDNNTFTTLEHPDNPIRLAGVHLHSDEEASAWLREHLKEGAHVRIAYAQDPTQQIAHDTLHTIRSVVYSHGVQLNRAAIESGYGNATDEHNPAGIHVQYSDSEIFWGKLIERLAHLPVPIIHNKFMPVDSPLELYKRTQVYGKDWQDWRHPFRDYLFPSFESFAQQGVWGWTVGAGTLGAMLGTNMKSRAILAGLSSLTAMTLAAIRTQSPIPTYRRKERNVDEYFDILKYIKYEGLYEKTASWIKSHQHHDIGALSDRYEAEGSVRKRRIQVLKQEKRKLLVSGEKKYHARVKEINDEIRSLQSYRAKLNLTREDVLALQYKSMARTTLYGSDSHGNLQKVLLALDPKEREYFQAFLKAPGPEREKILQLVPNDERRFLEAAWGMKPEEKPDLTQYFSKHYLPPDDWRGWAADSDLDQYRLVVMKQEGLDMTSHGFWPQDEEQARQDRIPDLRPNRATQGDLKAQLKRALSGAGLRDVDIQLTPTAAQQHKITMRIADDRKKQQQQLTA